MTEDPRRVLAVDHGDKRIGIAVSDPSAVIANPYRVIQHVSRIIDAATVADIANELGAVRIIVGCPYDEDGGIGPQARKILRFVTELRRQTILPIEVWDESGSTLMAREAHNGIKGSRRKSKKHLDDIAATAILQSYLDTQHQRDQDLLKRIDKDG